MTFHEKSWLTFWSGWEQILQRDKDAQEKAPEVLKQDLKSKTSTGTPSGTRSFSTSARRPAEMAEMVRFEDTRVTGLEYPDAGFGHKFALPNIAGFQKPDNMKKRYDPVVQQVTRSLMRDGKLSKAQTVRQLPSIY